MASFFNLTLDTTMPTISIEAPLYTTTYADTTIKINSNETLDTFQDIYIIDSLGSRHDVILNYFNTYFEGTFKLSGYPLGICTIYARCRDDVLNLSGYIMQTMNITNESTVWQLNSVGSLFLKGVLIEGDTYLSVNKNGDMVTYQLIENEVAENLLSIGQDGTVIIKGELIES